MGTSTCSSCQAEVPEGAESCPACGTPVAAAVTTAPDPAPPEAAPAAAPPPVGEPVAAGPSATAFKFDLNRLTVADRITGCAAIVLFISLFLPWFGVDIGGFDYSNSGLSAHGFLYLTLIITIVLIGYLVARAGWSALPFSLPLKHDNCCWRRPGSTWCSL